MHFKLLIVDPSKESRENIKNILASSSIGIEILGELDSGEIVFEYIKINMPDIILLDVGIPGAMGMELLKKIKEYYRYIVVIIMSETSSFSQAREAMKYEAFDFFVKPVESESFIENMLRAEKHLTEERKKEIELIELRSKLDKGIFQLKGQLLDTIQNKDTDRIDKDNGESKIDGGNLCTVVLIKIINFNIVMKNDFENDAELVKMGIREKIKTILDQAGLKLSEISFQQELLLLRCQDTEDTIYNDIYIAAQRIKMTIEENTDFRMNIGIGRACVDDLGSCVSYRQAIKALQNIQFIDCGGIIQIEEIKEQEVYVLPFDQEADLLAHLEKGYRDQAYLFIDNIFDEFEKKQIEISIIRDIIKELSFNIEKLVRQYDGLFQNLVQEDGFIFDIINNLSSLTELRQWLKDLIEKVTEFIYCRKKAGIPAIITQILEYMESHYFDCLNLGFIAEKFNISIAYLSRSFKNITGEKYIDHLNRIRMEKSAEKLINYRDLKVKDIAEMVGFENPYYFMKRFKQYFNCTPSEYRKKK